LTNKTDVTIEVFEICYQMSLMF